MKEGKRKRKLPAEGLGVTGVLDPSTFQDFLVLHYVHNPPCKSVQSHGLDKVA